MRALDQIAQLRRGRRIPLEGLVKQLLDLPRNFGRVVETDHATAAFQGMKCAPDRGKRLEVVRLLLARRQHVLDFAQHLSGFVEEYPEQFLGSAAIDYRNRLVDVECGPDFGLARRQMRRDGRCKCIECGGVPLGSAGTVSAAEKGVRGGLRESAAG